MLGLTVNLNVLNPTGGGHAFGERYVYTDLRDRSPLLFREEMEAEVSQIIRLSVSGKF